jgi:hypothetical protein
MILPSKHLAQNRALLTVGGRILVFLTRPKTVSALWESVNEQAQNTGPASLGRISYDWFLLALDLLYTLNAIELNDGLIKRSAV